MKRSHLSAGLVPEFISVDVTPSKSNGILSICVLSILVRRLKQCPKPYLAFNKMHAGKQSRHLPAQCTITR